MRKKIAVFLVICVMMVSVVGCGSDGGRRQQGRRRGRQCSQRLKWAVLIRKIMMKKKLRQRIK